MTKDRLRTCVSFLCFVSSPRPSAKPNPVVCCWTIPQPSCSSWPPLRGTECLPNDEDICRSSLVDWSCRQLWVTMQGKLREIDQLISCCHRQPQGWLFFCQQVRGSLGANIVSSITAAVGVLLLTLNLSQDFTYMNYCNDLNEDDGCFGASLVTVCVSSENTLSVKTCFSSRDTIPHLEFPSRHLKLWTFRVRWPYSHIP